MRGVLINSRGQVWVETVIYTLIAFSLIGLVLGFARPRIQELQDKTLIEQSINTMQDIDLTFEELKRVPGNKRVLEVKVSKGFLRVDGFNDELSFEFEGGYTYSEPGENISEGNLLISSSEKGKISFVNISRDYSSFNLTFDGKDDSKLINKAPSPYRFIISNEGKDPQDKTVININLG